MLIVIFIVTILCFTYYQNKKEEDTNNDVSTKSMQDSYDRSVSKNKNLVLKIALIGVFSALSYIGTMIHIPIPSPLGKPMIHLGNLVVVIASLLFGGVVGGLSGSIGMGLYDILGGYDLWSILRTIILKLIMGLIVGSLYERIIKKKKNSANVFLPIIGLILLVIGVIFMVIAINGDGSIANKLNNKQEVIYWPVYVFSILCGLFLIVIGFLNKKMSFKLQAANIATSTAIIFNIIGEFIYKVLKQAMLGGSSLTLSIYTGFLSVPATLLNAMITLAIILFIFIPVETAVKKSLNK